jgi:hypothetical protein
MSKIDREKKTIAFPDGSTEIDRTLGELEIVIDYENFKLSL